MGILNDIKILMFEFGLLNLEKKTTQYQIKAVTSVCKHGGKIYKIVKIS